MQLLKDATPHLMTVGEYFASNIQGHTELIEGIAYDVSPEDEPHAFAVQQLNQFLLPKVMQFGQVLRIQSPIAVPDWQGRNAPEMDVTVIARKQYDRTPTSADAFAIIEVSDTTYDDDRERKIPLYVNAGVPAWIVNIQLRQVEFYGSVADLAIEHGHVFPEHGTINVLGVSIPVADLFTVRPDANR